MASLNERFGLMAADKARTTGDENLHTLI